MDDNKIAPSEGDEKDKQVKDGAEDWKPIVGDKFKSEAELAKAYKELETKLGQSSDEVRKSREFAEQIAPLLEEIRKDPEIFNKLDERLRKKGQPDNQPADSKDAKIADNTEVRTALSNKALADFESKHGIDKLSPEDQKIQRKKIGDAIYDLTGQTLSEVDLRRLDTVLENAYLVANKDEVIKKSKLEALAEAQGVEEGSISSLPSSQGKSETTLTPEESAVAERLGLTKEQYLEGKKSPTKSK